MRLAILADTHMPRGARRLPDECVRRLRAADLIVHAGDFTGPQALAEIEALGPPLVAVHGNVDAPEVIERLPSRTVFRADAARIALLHDAGPRRGRLARLRREFPDAEVVVFGHSHMPLHEVAAGDGGSGPRFQIFNPGSPTERRRAPARTMGLAETSGDAVRFSLVELG